MYVIIIKGAGSAFCAGIDLNEFRNKTTLEYSNWLAAFDQFMQTIALMTKPVFRAYPKGMTLLFLLALLLPPRIFFGKVAISPLEGSFYAFLLLNSFKLCYFRC